MNWCKALCALSIAVYGSACLAQDITDVEAKPYGSYTGGAIDTVDLATGNLMLNIPLVSFPQLGSLPPLSFSVELNNAPYSQTWWACDPNGFSDDGIDCMLLSARYDTSPPGAVYQNPVSITEEGSSVTMPWSCPGESPCTVSEEWGSEYGQIQNMGAYLTSSFEGGIVTGQVYSEPYSNNDQIGEIQFSMVDPSGTTHNLESDASNPPSSWNTYRAADGSGYTFIPKGTPNSTSSVNGNAYNPWDLTNIGVGQSFESGSVNSADYWISNANPNESGVSGGVRLGTLYSPTGIQYTDNIVSYPMTPTNSSYASTRNSLNESLVPRALITTAQDPSGNTITRGPWYWSGYWAYSGSEFTDIQNIYSTNPPKYVDSVGRVIPDVIAMQATLYPWNASPELTTSMTWQVPGPGGTTLPYQINYIATGNGVYWAPPPSLTAGVIQDPDPSIDVNFKGWTISSIVLPNGTSWGFKYYQSEISAETSPYGSPLFPGALLPGELDSPGDLEEITTPSGGTISYRYMTIPPVPNSALQLGRCNSVCHAVASRTETDGLSGPGQHSWTTYYSYGDSSTIEPSNPPMHYGFSTTEYDPMGNQTNHSFIAITGGSGTPVQNQYHETGTDYFSNNGQWLKSVDTSYGDYQNDIAPSVNTGSTVGVVNVLPTQITTDTPGVVSSTEIRKYSNNVGNPLFTASKITCNENSACSATDHNANNQTIIPISYLSPVTDTVSDGSGNVLRTTSTIFEFQNPPSVYTSAHMDALPVSQTVSGFSGAVGTVSGTTVYGYDQNNPTACPSPAASNGIFGNLTSKTESYSMGGSTTTQTVYNCQGMPVTKTDGNGNQTNITYDSTGLFASSIQRPTTNGDTHIDQYTHDLNTSELILHTDENNQTTSYGYDAMGRVTSISYPDGGGSSFCYTDIGGSIPGCGTSPGTAPYSLYTSTTAGTATAPAPPITTKHTYDGWGRQYTSSVTSDPQGQTTTNTTYDWEGRVTSVKNPYRSSPSPGDPPPGTTSYMYDVLGRKTIQTQPDGSIQQWCYDGIATNGQTNCSTKIAMKLGQFTPASWTDISDETGRHTQQIFDALGHMGAVVEPDPVSGSLALETDYTYDVFGDLLNVNQAGASGSTPVTRSFAYDMPSRVTFACNPEALAAGQSCTSSSGAGTRYIYDANSNLTSKTDNRGIATNYAYDALNRLLSKTYLNDPSGTASSCYQYDGGASATNSSTTTNGSGRLAAQWTQKGACLSSSPVQTKTIIMAYDAMGRLLNEQRCMSLTNCANGGYPMSYTYDLTGKLLTYPSGYGNLNFANSYDTAGRLSTVTQGANPPLFSVPSYTPAGALSGVQLGASISMSRTFDSRQRVTSETDSSPANVGNVPGTATVAIFGSEQSK